MRWYQALTVYLYLVELRWFGSSSVSHEKKQILRSFHFLNSRLPLNFHFLFGKIEKCRFDLELLLVTKFEMLWKDQKPYSCWWKGYFSVSYIDWIHLDLRGWRSIFKKFERSIYFNYFDSEGISIHSESILQNISSFLFLCSLFLPRKSETWIATKGATIIAKIISQSEISIFTFLKLAHYRSMLAKLLY